MATELPVMTELDDNGNGKLRVVCPGGRPSDECTGTHPPVLETVDSWKKKAVTWGLLLAAIGVTWLAWGAYRQVRDELHAFQRVGIGNHDQSSTSHRDIRDRQDRSDKANQIAHKDIRDKLDVLIARPAYAPPRRTRRRRRRFGLK